ncbi:hypothetical protein BKK81_33695 (plasmid) [Cupriavidus sp. USMAHM13]|nr:hypothetical protein BKK81_33695 [Cupriavidus sp. USMAHM13]
MLVAEAVKVIWKVPAMEQGVQDGTSQRFVCAELDPQADHSEVENAITRITAIWTPRHSCFRWTVYCC